MQIASEVRWERLFPDELEAAFAACPVVFMPYGICEPHGPQNAVGLDGLKAHGICCAAAREYGGIVAPTDYWHVHECGGYAVWANENIGERRPWLTAVPPWIHFKNVCYHVRALDAAGFHAAILLTGHYGENWKDLKTLVKILQPHFAIRIYGLPDFEANETGFGDGGPNLDHAGRVETSQLWALEPVCVDMTRMPPKEQNGPHFAMGSTAYEVNLHVGERMVRDQVKWLGKKMKELLLEYDKSKPSSRQPLSFERIERLWADEVLPQLPNFASMQQLFPDQSKGPPACSRWYPNWAIPRISS
jgi:creatinine amidohydrolase